MPLFTQVLGRKLWGNTVILPSQNNCDSLKFTFHNNEIFLNGGLYDKGFLYTVPSFLEKFQFLEV